MITAVKKMLQAKAEYRASRALRDTLPEEYRFVFDAVEKYLFSLAADQSVMPVLMDTLETFAVAASNGRPVGSLIGADVGLFCDTLIEKGRVRTWADTQRDALKRAVEKRFGTGRKPEAAP
jgi:DNA-binding ferritin-like protein (Dps family)